MNIFLDIFCLTQHRLAHPDAQPMKKINEIIIS